MWGMVFGNGHWAMISRGPGFLAEVGNTHSGRTILPERREWPHLLPFSLRFFEPITLSDPTGGGRNESQAHAAPTCLPREGLPLAKREPRQVSGHVSRHVAQLPGLQLSHRRCALAKPPTGGFMAEAWNYFPDPRRPERPSQDSRLAIAGEQRAPANSWQNCTNLPLLGHARQACSAPNSAFSHGVFSTAVLALPSPAAGRSRRRAR